MILPPGALVNDYLCMLGEQTFWHALLAEFPDLQDWTGTEYAKLPNVVEERFFDAEDSETCPQYVIRNTTYFRPLRLPIPQIGILQDPYLPSNGAWTAEEAAGRVFDVGRAEQAAVAASCRRTVFNSRYTASLYPEMHERGLVIPIAVDPLRFPLRKMEEANRVPKVCWVGSNNPVKGMDRLWKIIQTTPYEFVVVTKDGSDLTHPRVQCFSQLSQLQLLDVFATCDVGLCTSRLETQHLSGIEMGYTGLPVVATNVGGYWERPDGVWGSAGSLATLVERLHAVVTRDPNPVAVREYWMAEHTPDVVMPQWRALVERVLAEEGR